MQYETRQHSSSMSTTRFGGSGGSGMMPLCKVIRIGKRVQPDISKARQQVNIDRPAYNKTDKQCRTRTTITARLPDG